MRGWLIAAIVLAALAIGGYQAFELYYPYYASDQLRQAARSTIAVEVLRQRINGVALPQGLRIWPETEGHVRNALLSKAEKFGVPLIEKDIAIWHEGRKVYCRVAWEQEVKLFSFSLGNILFDWTEEVPLN